MLRCPFSIRVHGCCDDYECTQGHAQRITRAPRHFPPFIPHNAKHRRRSTLTLHSPRLPPAFLLSSFPWVSMPHCGVSPPRPRRTHAPAALYSTWSIRTRLFVEAQRPGVCGSGRQDLFLLLLLCGVVFGEGAWPSPVRVSQGGAPSHCTPTRTRRSRIALG
jgi:hypothetical protein